MLRNKLRYLLLLATAGLIIILFNKYYLGMIFLTIVLMPFFLFGLLSYCYGKMRAELVCLTHVANKGDRIPISVQITNPTIFPISFVKLYVTYKNAYSTRTFKRTVCASVDYRTKTSVFFHLTSYYAGNMEITLEGIRVYDYMKLFSLKRKIRSEIKVAVLPSYYELEESQLIQREAPLLESDNYSPVQKGDDPSEVFEIREYREGDRLQRVHWKLSLKEDKLMIKEFSDPLSCRELLFINLNMDEEENTLRTIDALLECVFSLSYSLIRNEHMHDISWYDSDHGVCKRVRISSEKDLFDAVDGLLHAKPFQEEVDSLTMYQAEFPHDQYSDLLFISSNLSVPSIDAFTGVRAYTRQMIYLKDEKDEPGRELLEDYKEAGVHLWPIRLGAIREDMEQLSPGAL